MLFCTAVARACAPSSPISLKDRSIVVCIYAKINVCRIHSDSENYLTALYGHAVIRAAAPKALMWFECRAMVVSICVDKKRVS